MDGLIWVLQSLPHLARRSITFDRGPEFTDWPYLQASIGHRHGSGIRNRPGRKVLSKTPTDGPENGFRERSTRCRSATVISPRYAII